MINDQAPVTKDIAIDEVKMVEIQPVIIQEKFIVGNGLANIGNNCYMNSVVQMFAHLPLVLTRLQTCQGGISDSLKQTI